MARWTSRFRRSKSLGGGFRLNLTKRGIGMSVGGRGLRRSWHSTGRRTTSAGLPGTGLSWQKVEGLDYGQQPSVSAAYSHGETRSELVNLARRAQREIEDSQ